MDLNQYARTRPPCNKCRLIRAGAVCFSSNTPESSCCSCSDGQASCHRTVSLHQPNCCEPASLWLQLQVCTEMMAAACSESLNYELQTEADHAAHPGCKVLQSFIGMVCHLPFPARQSNQGPSSCSRWAQWPFGHVQSQLLHDSLQQ